MAITLAQIVDALTAAGIGAREWRGDRKHRVYVDVDYRLLPERSARAAKDLGRCWVEIDADGDVVVDADAVGLLPTTDGANAIRAVKAALRAVVDRPCDMFGGL